MTGNRLVDGSYNRSQVRTNRFQRNVPRAQETIYEYLLEIVKSWQPEDVLAEFKHLFIHHVNTISSHTLPSLYEIVFANQEQEFRNTLKRSCYILINNWDIARNHKYIQQLIHLFEDPILQRNTMSPTLQRLRSWLRAFVASKDFQELKLFAARYEEREPIHWSQRYTSYLLVPQYIDLQNPIEQRQAARALSKQLKDKFKFDLALYTARSQSVIPAEVTPKNPTALGDDALRLIKIIVARRGIFSHVNVANIFLNQTHHLTYSQFKQSLHRYLISPVSHQEEAQGLSNQLMERIDRLYHNYDDKPIDEALLLRTCNKVIDHLTTENHQDPSPLFALLLSNGHPLTLVIILLKIILICRFCRTHLEARIAELIQYYETYQEEECKWVVHFFEIFRVTMAIYTENIEYNLVSMSRANQPASLSETVSNLDTYRIFSQPRRAHSTEDDVVELGLLATLAEQVNQNESSDVGESSGNQ